MQVRIDIARIESARVGGTCERWFMIKIGVAGGAWTATPAGADCPWIIFVPLFAEYNPVIVIAALM